MGDAMRRLEKPEVRNEGQDASQDTTQSGAADHQGWCPKHFIWGGWPDPSPREEVRGIAKNWCKSKRDIHTMRLAANAPRRREEIAMLSTRRPSRDRTFKIARAIKTRRKKDGPSSRALCQRPW